MSFQIGLLNLLILLSTHIVVLYRILKKKQYPLFALFWLALFWLSIFLMHPLSKWVWLNLPLLSNLQYTFRLLFLPMLSSSILAGYLIFIIPKKFKLFLAVFLISAAIVANRNHLGVLNKEIDMNIVSSYEGTFDIVGENLPKYVSLAEIKNEVESSQDRKEFVISQGKGLILFQKRQDLISDAEILLYSPGKVFIRRIYFPGWQIFVNNKKIDNIEKGNGMTISLPPGTSKIHSFYQDPPIIKFTNSVSLIAAAANLIFIFYRMYNIVTAPIA